ncbi:MAG: kinase/pyrophosphorylase [Hydrogenibacillus schlegelii]|nr:kinase/pyrophosphorylase [Hydrogenibacillus schlegelii]
MSPETNKHAETHAGAETKKNARPPNETEPAAGADDGAPLPGDASGHEGSGAVGGVNVGSAGDESAPGVRAAPGDGKKTVIYVLSDSLGETAEYAVRAAVSQFDYDTIDIRRIPFVDDISTLDEVLVSAKENEALIVYTLVVPELSAYLREKSAALGLEAIDLMTPLLERIARRTGQRPKHKPGLVHKLDEDYFKRVEAIEFAVKYDDGKDPRGILRADIVLIGVSRTSKTPLSMYLAHRRIKVANVPLVPEVAPPKELFQVSANRIIGLTIHPEALHQIRTERLKSLGLGLSASYARMERILEELEYAENLMKRLGCPVIDVTNKAVEETASLILQMIKGGRIR